MKVEILDVHGLESSIKAMRLPMKSGEKSDSGPCSLPICKTCTLRETRECGLYKFSDFVIGKEDHALAMKLIKAGASHRKHLRLIDAWFEIEAPRYFWSEFDTYRQGVDKVSESTMHRILKDKIGFEDFDGTDFYTIKHFIDRVENIKESNNYTDSEKITMVKACLPEGYRQKRIVKCSYEALKAMYQDRKNHRLQEWREFCEVIKLLPYSEFITGEEVTDYGEN